MNAAHSKKCKSKRQITWCVLVNVKRYTWLHVSPHRSKFMGAWTVATLVCVCCSTSPAWQVQRSSSSDWSSPPFGICRLECKEGSPAYKCVARLHTILFPLTTMLHVEKGRARFTFFWEVWLKLDSLCCHSQHSRLHWKIEQRHQFLLTRKIWRKVSTFSAKILTLAHLVYLSRLQFWTSLPATRKG